MDIFEYLSSSPEFMSGFKIGFIVFGTITLLLFLLKLFTGINYKPLKGTGGFIGSIVMGIILAFKGEDD